jgi:glycosyltransferase involved in cell wall biosynthesis
MPKEISNPNILRIINLTEEGRWGGPQARIALIAKRLQRNGIETLVVAPNRDSNEFHRRLHQLGVRHKLLNLHRLTKERAILWRYFIFFGPEVLQLVRLIQDESVNIIHCNGAWQIKGILAGWLGKRKIIWHLNDTRKSTILNITYRLLARLVDAFIVSSVRTKDCYFSGDSQSKDKRYCVIQAPVDTDLFNPESVKPAEDLLRSNNLKILTVANISPGKGMEDFIDMAHVLVQKGHTVEFLIAGAHSASQRHYIETLKEKIRHYGLGNIRFLGSRVDIASVLQAADIYVCSSWTESSPMSVWEAMSMAKPIVSTDVGDVAHYILDGENGFIVPPGDPAALAEKVEVLIGNPELRKNFGNLAREVARRNLDVQIAAQKHESFYRLLVGNNGLQVKAAQ